MTRIVIHQIGEGQTPEEFPGAPNLNPARIVELVEAGTWTWRDLKPRGLAAAWPVVVPDGKEIVDATRRFEQGSDHKWREVYDLIDKPPPRKVVPLTISDRQFFQQLAVEGTISREEALEAVKIGKLPPTLEALVAAIADEDDRFNAEMLLSGATTFERHHPMTDVIAAATGRSTDQTDDFFIAAALL